MFFAFCLLKVSGDPAVPNPKLPGNNVPPLANALPRVVPAAQPPINFPLMFTLGVGVSGDGAGEGAPGAGVGVSGDTVLGVGVSGDGVGAPGDGVGPGIHCEYQSSLNLHFEPSQQVVLPE